MERIIVESKPDASGKTEFRAYLESDPQTVHAGDTIPSAIGFLVQDHAERLGLKIQYPYP